MCKRLANSPAVLTWPLWVLLIAPGAQAPLGAHPSPPPKINVWSGRVSWYGNEFQGRRTASGGIYDMFEATAAHPWLPFGSLLRLTNLKTGQNQVVRVNDRGPFWPERELHVCCLVATRLGLMDVGVARLRIELLEEPQLP